MRDACQLLHEELSRLPHFDASFDAKLLPRSGVYMMFERGEAAHGAARIVRVGSHTGESGILSQRLDEHYRKSNKDRSIFRKHVGRCILARRQDPFLPHWEIDLTSRENKEKFCSLIDSEKQEAVENEVTSYLAANISFVVLPVMGLKTRKLAEKMLLSTIAACGICHASPQWLGRFHSHQLIKKYGLWNIQGLQGTPLSAYGVQSIMSQEFGLNN